MTIIPIRMNVAYLYGRLEVEGGRTSLVGVVVVVCSPINKCHDKYII